MLREGEIEQSSDIIAGMKYPTALEIRKDQYQKMLDDILLKLPAEACGVLGGRDQVVMLVRPVKNISQRTDRFRMDPEGQIQALFEIEDQDLELVGIYHSHPQGPTSPSSVDIEEAAFPEAAYLVWYPSGNTWHCRAYAMREGQPREIPLLILT